MEERTGGRNTPASSREPASTLPIWDKQLVDAALHGCDRLWAGLVEETYPTVRASVRHQYAQLAEKGIQTTNELADEATQHVFLELLENGFKNYNGKCSLRRYVWAVASRRALDYAVRKTGYRCYLFLGDAEAISRRNVCQERLSGPDEVQRWHDYHAGLQKAGLSKREKLFLELAIEEGLKPGEVAARASKILGKKITPANASTTLANARRKVAEYLAREVTKRRK